MSAATATPAKKEEKTGLLATVANNARQYGIVGALLVIVVAFEVLTGGVLLKPNSFVSLIQQNAYVIILAIGMVMVIIATHIDLSVFADGSVLRGKAPLRARRDSAASSAPGWRPGAKELLRTSSRHRRVLDDERLPAQPSTPGTRHSPSWTRIAVSTPICTHRGILPCRHLE